MTTTILPILSPALTPATSAMITISAGSTMAVGVYSTAPGATPSGSFAIESATPGAPTLIDTIGAGRMLTHLHGPLSFTVRRPALTGTAFGVYTEV